MWLLFSPYYLELYVGQFTFITASLMFWAYLGWQRSAGRPVESADESVTFPARWRAALADLSFAGAVWLKLMPLLYAPLALLRGRWKGLLVTGAGLAVTSWAYFARFPRDWSIFAATNGDPRPTWHAGNHGLMALLFDLSGVRVAPFLAARAVVLAAVGAGLLLLFCRAWQETRAEGAGAAPRRPSPFRRFVLSHSRRAGGAEGALPALYAGCSAAYLLIYKDVWEHHYVVLLPPLVLLALRGERARLWLPPFLVCALPGLFVLCDVPALGYNEDPQRYWRPAVSLLHHGWKPLAPLWLLAGLVIQALPGRRFSFPPPLFAGRRRAVAFALSLAGVLTLGAGTRWAAAELAAQRQVSRVLVWPEGVFHRQSRPETCGPAALASVCRYYGLRAEEMELAGLAGTTGAGTSMLGLQEAARAKGLVTRAVRVSPAELRRLPRPSILFFHEGHFAVLTGVQGSRFYLADPSLGQQVWSERRLARQWNGEALLAGPATP